MVSCSFPWVLRNIIAWAEANILNVFDTVLAEPLVSSFAHVYQHLRNENAVEENADLESFCDKSQHLLFWEGRRPHDVKMVERFFVQWIDTVDPGNASRIVGLRFEENRAYCIGSNNWCISLTITRRYMLARVDNSTTLSLKRYRPSWKKDAVVSTLSHSPRAFVGLWQNWTLLWRQTRIKRTSAALKSTLVRSI
jgi:hypothetical protein